MEIKRCFLDTETGGFDKDKNGLIQVAGAIDINGKIEEQFSFDMKPPKNKVIEAEALEVNNLTIEMINNFQPSTTAFHKFRQVMKKYVDPYDSKDKLFFLAYNSSFDEGFIRRWFQDNNDQYFGSLFWNPCIDIAGLAGDHLMEERDQLTNFKLETVMRYLDIVATGKLHGALVDAIAARDVYYEVKDGNQTELF